MPTAGDERDNEYLREFRAQDGHGLGVGDLDGWLRRTSAAAAGYARRVACVRRYAFAVPDAPALAAIARYSPIVELGAGTGYWAYLLRAQGVDIVAYDLAPPDRSPNAYKLDPRTWTEVRPGGVDILADYPDRALFLCWPGYRDSFADEALAAYHGNRLIYIGEDRGGNTANAAFFDRLHLKWALDERLAIPRWPGAHDSLQIYYRQPPS
jgi:hypothetical protein